MCAACVCVGWGVGKWVGACPTCGTSSGFLNSSSRVQGLPNSVRIHRRALDTCGTIGAQGTQPA